jgi:TPR repeat protein
MPAAAQPSSSTTKVSGTGTAVAALGNVPVIVPRAAAPSPMAAGLLARGLELLRARDISGARLLFQRAASEGSAQAAFHLAETYDPRMLVAWQVIGIAGDPARARDLYERAARDGVPNARERLSALR